LFGDSRRCTVQAVSNSGMHEEAQGATMRFPTWLRFAVPVDGVYWREWREPPSDPPRGRERRSNHLADSHNLPEKASEGAVISGGNNKWIYVR
jgi:hypothetical protein